MVRYEAMVRTPSQDELRQWREEFEAASRRPLRTRFRYAFIHTYKPVLDDATLSLVRRRWPSASCMVRSGPCRSGSDMAAEV